MEWGIIIASVSAIFAGGGLIFTAYERHKETQIATGTFWLELEKMFKEYDSFYEHLRFKHGKWICSDVDGPTTAKEWAMFCDYLGLFEHCYILLKKGSIDLPTFQSVYKTRVMGLLSNKIIRDELLNEKWQTFRDLLQKLNLMRYNDIVPIEECREFVYSRRNNTT